MKTLLIFPPIWDTTQPFIAIPSLTAFIRKSGYSVEQMDLNINCQDYFLSSEYLNKLLSLKEAKFPKIDRQVAKQIVEYILNNIDQVKKDLRSDRFYDPESYLQAKMIISSAFSLISASHNPTKIYGRSFKMRYSDRSSQEIFEATLDRIENPFIFYYEQKTIPEIKKIAPKLVGISITDYNQIIPAFTLSRLIKKDFPEVHITFGGFLMEYLAPLLKKNDKFFGFFFDSIIFGEGEIPLLRLIEALNKDQDFTKIPNFIYQENKNATIKEKVEYTKTKDILSINDFPTPDYDGFPLEKYLAPEIVFPLRTSKGCYWNKCTFCDDIKIYGRYYSQRKTSKVLEDLKNLQEKYQAKYISFTDLAVSAKIARQWALAIKKENLELSWLMLARMEKSFTKELCEDLRAGGCSFILFGMESASQRILDLIKKGTKLPEMKDVCINVHNAGIWCHLFTFTGFPSETDEEVQKTIDFVEEMSEYIDSVGISSFVLTKETPIFKNPELFGIENIYDRPDYDLNNTAAFVSKQEMNGADKKESFKRYIHSVWKKYNQPLWMLEKAQAPVFLYVNHYGQKEMRKVVYPIANAKVEIEDK